MLILAITNGMKTVVMIVAMIAVFYLFLIRPQSQKAKQEGEYRNNLKKGDQVMTAGGIHATIVSTTDTKAVIEIAQGTRIEVAKTTVQPIPERKRK